MCATTTTQLRIMLKQRRAPSTPTRGDALIASQLSRAKAAIYLSFDAMYGHPFWRQNAPLIYRSRMATKPSAPARRPRPRAIVLAEHGEVPVKLTSRAKGLLERKP